MPIDRCGLPVGLKSGDRSVDALAMAARPEYVGSQQRAGTSRRCPDCGSPMEPGADDSYRICQACYDAYVDNAGR